MFSFMAIKPIQSKKGLNVHGIGSTSCCEEIDRM